MDKTIELLETALATVEPQYFDAKAYYDNLDRKCKDALKKSRAWTRYTNLRAAVEGIGNALHALEALR